MHSFNNKVLIEQETSLIKQVILDIEKYPEFLPWCSGAKIISKSKNEIIADLTIKFMTFKETYRSKIIISEKNEDFTVEVEAISGPFRYLKNFWDIKKINNASEIYFSIDFEFKSRILDSVIGTFFSMAADKMIGAFEMRANELAKK